MTINKNTIKNIPLLQNVKTTMKASAHARCVSFQELDPTLSVALSVFPPRARSQTCACYSRNPNLSLPLPPPQHLGRCDVTASSDKHSHFLPGCTSAPSTFIPTPPPPPPPRKLPCVSRCDGGLLPSLPHLYSSSLLPLSIPCRSSSIPLLFSHLCMWWESDLPLSSPPFPSPHTPPSPHQPASNFRFFSFFFSSCSSSRGWR